MSITLLTTDVLILGSGLSGLRSAWAAREHNPKLGVTVACLREGPSGSSFTNRNDALGYQLLDTDDRKSSFVEEALSLGWPGFIDEKLVTILATESEPRFREMEELGLPFRRNEAGHLSRYPGCGSLEPRAVIFDDLHSAFNRYLKKTVDCNCGFLTGFEALGFITNHDEICGAWGRTPSIGRIVAVRSKSVIMALGGPAPLFPGHIAGSANPGLGYGLMSEVGVKSANTSCLQYMWGERDRSFISPAKLLAAGNLILHENSTTESPADSFGSALTELCTARSIHCPAFYHRPDTQLDRMLIDSRWADDFARIKTKDTTIEAGLFAHAGNGGAVTDENGETSLRNLFAIGECATGMHGANRMGGAMILATQVFGRRAGIEAANRAATTTLIGKKSFAKICRDIPETAEKLGTQKGIIQKIRTGLQCHALFGGQDGILKFREWLEEKAQSEDRLVKLTALSALEASRPIPSPKEET